MVAKALVLIHARSTGIVVEVEPLHGDEDGDGGVVSYEFINRTVGGRVSRGFVRSAEPPSGEAAQRPRRDPTRFRRTTPPPATGVVRRSLPDPGPGRFEVCERAGVRDR